MDTLIIPVNKLQATIHLNGRMAGLLDLAETIQKEDYTTRAQIMGAIHNLIDEAREMIND